MEEENRNKKGRLSHVRWEWQEGILSALRLALHCTHLWAKADPLLSQLQLK